MRGSCLCGGVTYEVTAPIERLGHCHCRMCRKAHGAAFATYGRVSARAFRFTSGERLVKRYQSSVPVTRSFCGDCGSNLTFSYAPLPEVLWIAAGSFDEDPGVRPLSHCFVASKAPWHELTDDLKQYPDFPDAGEA